MKRKAILVDQNTHSTTKIYVDEANAWEILPYLYQDGIEKEFKEIRGILKENLRNAEKYCKCNVSGKADKMYEMRFVKGRNDRIYCQEIRGKVRAIVMVELFAGKKSQEIPKRVKERIENMGGYEYELEG